MYLDFLCRPNEYQVKGVLIVEIWHILNHSEFI